MGTRLGGGEGAAARKAERAENRRPAGQRAACCRERGRAGLEGANEATRLSEQLRPGVHDVRRAVRFPQKCRFAQMQAKKKVNSWVHLGVDFLQVGEMKGRGNLI